MFSANDFDMIISMITEHTLKLAIFKLAQLILQRSVFQNSKTRKEQIHLSIKK